MLTGADSFGWSLCRDSAFRRALKAPCPPQLPYVGLRWALAATGPTAMTYSFAFRAALLAGKRGGAHAARGLEILRKPAEAGTAIAGTYQHGLCPHDCRRESEGIVDSRRMLADS